ncbi:hypothetical protein [Bombilactobacillus thymidiniphilus]|uniref:Uncharacterized protein n=1 Tax=Bombilactobacillus thymidiniphilus TaxID=2923363 RepID=A0ABY4PBR3_9LACO|nr:hypothetical protein [Bombilactobacillus thymidiniphilus]UQS83126.1 hypothetical protein MOO47_04895 [Bombilactobacillus thymidiniphilus]
MDKRYSEKFITSFLTFYIHHFNADDLEVISQYDVDHHVNELNAFIAWDRSFRLKDIVPLLINRHIEIINLLLDDLIQNADLAVDTLDTPQAWENWYTEQKNQISYPDR